MVPNNTRRRCSESIQDKEKKISPDFKGTRIRSSGFKQGKELSTGSKQFKEKELWVQTGEVHGAKLWV